jgi:hypothetical protein
MLIHGENLIYRAKNNGAKRIRSKSGSGRGERGTMRWGKIGSKDILDREKSNKTKGNIKRKIKKN